MYVLDQYPVQHTIHTEYLEEEWHHPTTMFSSTAAWSEANTTMAFSLTHPRGTPRYFGNFLYHKWDDLNNNIINIKYVLEHLKAIQEPIWKSSSSSSSSKSLLYVTFRHNWYFKWLCNTTIKTL